MEDGEAVAFYDDQKSRGAGAARFKHGLGYDGAIDDVEATQRHKSSHAPHAPPPMQRSPGGPLPLPGGMQPFPPGIAHLPGGPPPPFYGHHGHIPMMPPPGIPLPPPMGPHPGFHFPGMLPPHGRPPFMGMPPYPGPGRPPLPHFPPHGLPSGMPQPMVPPPLPPPEPGVQAGHPPTQGLSAEEAERQRVEEEVQAKAAEEERRRREEEADKIAEEARLRAEEEERKRRIAEAWTAHKSDDGQVYYYNTVTEESAWTKPEGFRGDAEAVAEQPRPVASILVEGTEWSEVKCHDGRVYFYHAAGGESSWTVPPVVAEAKENARKREAERLQARLQAAASKDRDRSRDEEAMRRDAIRKSSAVALPANLPKAQRVLLFKELLLDKGVTPFSRWEREVPKLEADPRWDALGTLKERRTAFDEFCRTTAVEQKRMKEERQKAVAAAFTTLLLEAEALERHLLQLRLVELQEQEAAAEGAEGKAGHQNGEGEGVQQINGEQEREQQELPDVSEVPLELSLEHLEKYWGNDPRWKDAEPNLREKLFEERFGATVRQLQAEREQRQASQRKQFLQLLRQVGVGSSSRWTKTKELLAGDAFFRTLDAYEREAWFREHVAQLQEAEAKAAAAEEERRAKEEAAAAKLAAQGEEAEKRRRKAAHADAVAAFRTLMGEVVKDPEARWVDWRARLEKDPQGRATSTALEPGETERLFREVTREMMERSTAGLKELLQEHLAPLVPPVEAGVGAELPEALKTFEAVAEMLEEDMRWARGPASLRECMWRQCCEELLLKRNRALGIEPERPKPEPLPPPPARNGPGGYDRPPPPGAPYGRDGEYRGGGRHHDYPQQWPERDYRGGYREEHGYKGDNSRGYEQDRGQGRRYHAHDGYDYQDRGQDRQKRSRY